MPDAPSSGVPVREIILRPTASSALSFGWQRMKQFFLDLFLVTVIVGFIIIPAAMIGSLDGHETPGGVLLRIFGFGYWFLLYAPIDYGAAFMFLEAARGQKFDVKDMFENFEHNYLNVVLANLLQKVIIGIGLVFLVIPGVIFACRLAFVKYLVQDRGLDPVAAVKESWRMTQGHAWEVFWLGALACLIASGGLICFGVGIIPAIMWIRSAFASMYLAVSKAEETLAAEPSPAQG